VRCNYANSTRQSQGLSDKWTEACGIEKQLQGCSTQVQLLPETVDLVDMPHAYSCRVQHTTTTTAATRTTRTKCGPTAAATNFSSI